MQILFNIQDDTSAARDFRGQVSAKSDGGDTAEVLADRAFAALGKSYDEHLAILEALERHKKTEALARLRQHIRASAQLVEEALRREGFSTT